MKLTTAIVNIAVIAVSGLACSVHADTYDWEVRANLTLTDSETEAPGFGGGRITSSSDTTSTDIVGTWFAGGLDDTDLIRSEAPFLARSSTVSLIYNRSDFDFDSETLTDTPINASFSTDAFGLGGRYVWQNTGWFVDGSYTSVDADLTTATALNAGVGKYVGENTTFTLAAVLTQQDFDSGLSSDDTDLVLSVKHLGRLPDSWWYGVAANLSNLSGGLSDPFYSATFSLYPNQDLALRFTTSGSFGDELNTARAYGLNAGWFVSKAFEVRGGYQWQTSDDSNATDTDTDGLTIGITYRF